MSTRNLRPSKYPKQRPSPHRPRSMLSDSPSASRVVCLPHCLDEEDNSSVPHWLVRPAVAAGLALGLQVRHNPVHFPQQCSRGQDC